MHSTIRLCRLIDEAITTFELRLEGITVLTEAASGAYGATAPLAAAAGADDVIAVTRDSAFGTAAEVIDATSSLAVALGVRDRIRFEDRLGPHIAGVHLVTNLGWVRPIDEDLLQRLPSDAGVALMCEPWEVRTSDVDLGACEAAGVPVLGTDENDPRLQTFRYVGLTALKVLLDEGVEVFRARVCVIGSSPFGTNVADVLKANGASVVRMDPADARGVQEAALEFVAAGVDAVVVAEHRIREPVLREGAPVPLELLAASDPLIVHLSGVVDTEALSDRGLRKVPGGHVEPGRMALTTAHVGPRPVIELHAAGLRVGQSLIHAMRRTGDRAAAMALALTESPALAVGG